MSVTSPPPWNEATAPTRSGTAAAVRNAIGPPMQYPCVPIFRFLRHRRLLVQPRDERLRIGHLRRLVQSLRERHQLRDRVLRAPLPAVGAFLTR